MSYQVCAVGNLPWVGAEMIWNGGERSLKPPGGSCEQPEQDNKKSHIKVK